MPSFVYLRDEFSRSLASAFLVPGYHVQEAFSLSEAVWICTQQHLGIVVIADNVKDPEIEQLRERFVIFSMKPNTSVRELLWKLALPEESAAAS